jgi:hypothetical protein
LLSATLDEGRPGANLPRSLCKSLGFEMDNMCLVRPEKVNASITAGPDYLYAAVSQAEAVCFRTPVPGRSQDYCHKTRRRSAVDFQAGIVGFFRNKEIVVLVNPKPAIQWAGIELYIFNLPSQTSVDFIYLLSRAKSNIDVPRG